MSKFDKIQMIKVDNGFWLMLIVYHIYINLSFTNIIILSFGSWRVNVWLPDYYCLRVENW